MRISIVLPVFNEERIISATLAGLKRLKPDEVIVVDGGSTDRTREIAQSLGVTLIYSSRGRGRQMNHGARQATGDVLLFLHADTRLPESAFDDIHAALADPRSIGGRFDVNLDGESWMLRIVGAMISQRSRITKVSTGDQAIFVRREVFEKIGGYPDIPLMEVVALSRTLKRMGRVACLRSQVVTSARRWEIEGVWRTIFKMWAFKLLQSKVNGAQYHGDELFPYKWDWPHDTYLQRQLRRLRKEVHFLHSNQSG